MDRGGDVDEPGHPMRPIGHVAPLACCCAVDLENAGRVVNGLVNVNAPPGEPLGDRPDCSLHKRPGRLVVGQVHAVENVPAVAAVRKDRLGPAGVLPQPVGTLTRRRLGRVVLGIGRGNATGPLGIEVEGQPAPPDYVDVTGGGFKVVCRLIRRPCQQGGVGFVQDEIDARGLPRVEGHRGLCGFVQVREVAGRGEGLAPPLLRNLQGSNLYHATGNVQQVETPPDFGNVGRRIGALAFGSGCRGHGRCSRALAIASSRVGPTASLPPIDTSCWPSDRRLYRAPMPRR